MYITQQLRLAVKLTWLLSRLQDFDDYTWFVHLRTLGSCVCGTYQSRMYIMVTLHESIFSIAIHMTNIPHFTLHTRSISKEALL
jgi:hypothetical protein